MSVNSSSAREEIDHPAPFGVPFPLPEVLGQFDVTGFLQGIAQRQPAVLAAIQGLPQVHDDPRPGRRQWVELEWVAEDVPKELTEAEPFGLRPTKPDTGG